MSDKTQLNPDIAMPIASPATAINSQLTTGMSDAICLQTGTILAGKYKIVKKMDVKTGEADLYLCQHNGQTYVAKLYRRAAAIKPEVVDKLMSIDHPSVSPVYAFDTYQSMPYEILPYYRLGSLEGRRFSYDELRASIIPSLNEALLSLHSVGIIHKDVKPTNIMLKDNKKDVVLIDFGISSLMNEGNTVLVTQTGMTPAYSAQETLHNLFLCESDYYSLGITIYELYCGHTPYHQDLTREEIAQYISSQKIPFPKDMPKLLQKLIMGLTYSDISNRNDKSNPNRRWTYEEVKNWCEGKEQAVPGTTAGVKAAESFPPFTFLNKIYDTLPSLVEALAEHWREGKKQLFRSLLSAHFKSHRPDITKLCLEAEQEAANSSGTDDLVYWKFLYGLHPKMTKFYWMGLSFESLPAMGRSMLEQLWDNDDRMYPAWDSILSEKVLSTYLILVKSDNKALAKSVEALEASYTLAENSKSHKLVHYYLLAYMLSGQRLYSIDNHQFVSPRELSDYMKSLLDISYEEFQAFCHRLVSYDEQLDPQLEAWLIALGKQKELERWQRGLSD